jgi:hypothetical protein
MKIKVKQIVGPGSSKNNPLTSSASEWSFSLCNMFAFFVRMTLMTRSSWLMIFLATVVNYDVIAKRHVILEYFM